MAEEFDTTNKPKVELIKHAKSAASPEGNPSPKEGSSEGSEKRKVVVVKKKTPPSGASQPGAAGSAQGSADAGGTVSKKPQPKVVVHTTAQEKGEGASSQDSGDTKKTVSVLPVQQRPAVAAGVVGGKPVGTPAGKQEKPKHEAPIPQEESKAVEKSSEGSQSGGSAEKPAARPTSSSPGTSSSTNAPPFPQRPAAAAGRVGGRPVGTQRGAPGGRSGTPGRPGAPAGSFPNRDRNAPGTGVPREGNRDGSGSGGRGAPQSRSGQRPGMPGRMGGGPRPGAPGRPLGAPVVPVMEGKPAAKKTFKAKKTVYQRKEEEMEEKLLQLKKKTTTVTNPVPKSIEITEVISVAELAKKMNLKASDLIQKLMSMGMMVTINQQIDAETAVILASEYGCEVKVVSLYDETVIESEADRQEDLKPRPPIVTVMGHVDHGKTKLLDAIRSSDVASTEFGGITQHIGAYMVETPHGAITFLDTPGHEAFTRMRARGAQVTDIVVLVVAADDGVMPQTIEALNHAKEAKVPIIVAINKIDKPEANPDRVKTQLSELGLMPEEWGGQTMFVEISALKKLGIDKLIDAILLQAEILELKANYTCRAEGKILESRIDHGRGIVATVIVQRGTLRVGDNFVAGVWAGKVRALFNDKGLRIEEATPSMPVEVLGFDGIPNAGDPLQVVEDERTARSISAKRQELKRFEDAKNIKKITLDNLYDTISDGEIKELKVIIKGDVQGSVEALRSSLEKLSTKEVRLNVIQALPGAINEGDVDLAAASNAIIIGFNVRPTPQAKALADQEKVEIRKYNIIYKAVEEIQQAMEGLLKPDTKEEVIAMVEVRETFKVPKVGTVAGCYVLSGTVKRTASVNVIREGIVIHTGKIASLKRFKDDVREVAAGYECGIGLENFNDIQVGDQFEVFEVVQVARKLGQENG
ncbi:translation initiation factor IF-2 [Treponema sp. J25]|uniref:translation initiation factor IF-2 n=1 Tax=Treponema sp. J25 TaxID=2094121 RepID=UPI00104B2B6E|nr:translation initiation factor IF-2 [Treponema sp. J25]TCW61378.1 translation initiation factor IF-2 [Treponema sp. J25]